MKKRLVIAIALLVLFSTYKPKKLFLINKFNIEIIEVENNLILKENEIKVIDTPEDHRKKLLETLDRSREQIIILSGWIMDYSVNEKFRNKLKRFDPALKAGLSYSDLESSYITPYAGLSLTYWMSDNFGLTVQTVNKYYSDDLIKSTPPGPSY